MKDSVKSLISLYSVLLGIAFTVFIVTSILSVFTIQDDENTHSHVDTAALISVQ